MWYCAPAIHRSSRLRSARSRTCWSESGAHNHGENRGSSPLGSASNINELCFCDRPVSRLCPMSKAIPKECMALLKQASEMFNETGCVPGFDGEEVPAE